MTMKKVAERAGVSIATVSAVINRNKFVSEPLCRKVNTAIKELGYKPNRLARSLATGSNLSLAYVVPDITNPLLSLITRGIQEVADEVDYSVILCNTSFSDKMLKRHVDQLIGSRIQGVVLAGIEECDQVITWFSEAAIPVVMALGPRPGVVTDGVYSDDRQGSRQAMESLQARGYSSIAFIGVEGHDSSNERLAGYRACVDSPYYRVEFGRSYLWNEGYEATLRLLKADRPEAILVVCDLMAFGCIRACQENGLRVPEDIKVVGFDNTYARLVNPMLDSVEIPALAMGRRAAQILLQRINDPTTPIVVEGMPTKLVLGEALEGDVRKASALR